MKKIILSALSIYFIFTFSLVSFAGQFEQTGEYYRYFEDDGTVAHNKMVYSGNDRYYVNSDGYVVFNSWIDYNDKYYYAGNDGKLYSGGIIEVDGYKYYLDNEGAMQKGWCNDYEYYADPDDGYLVNGFQELEVPRGFTTEISNERTAWFYFDSNTYKRVYAEKDAYVVRLVGERRYCFDQNGILRTGWRRIKDTVPVMKGYMYFVEETTELFKYGEAVTDTWYAVEPPKEVLSSTEVRYFHFNGQGQPRTANEGSYTKVRLDDKTFLFNEYGFAVYGVHRIGNDYYYFGPSVKDCSMKTGLITADVDGTNSGGNFYFADDGKGVTGIKSNKLYYKGKLQKADPEQKYAAVKINNVAYLVNTSGVIQKNKKKLKDGDGNEWTSNSSGVVPGTSGDASYTEAEPPYVSGEN